MRTILTAILRFFLGPGCGILLFVLIGLAYLTVKD